MTHLKGLLRKEWYLLKENGGWPSFQVLVVVVLGFLLGNYDSADYFKDLQEKSFFTSSYTSGNTQGGFVITITILIIVMILVVRYFVKHRS